MKSASMPGLSWPQFFLMMRAGLVQATLTKSSMVMWWPWTSVSTHSANAVSNPEMPDSATLYSTSFSSR